MGEAMRAALFPFVMSLPVLASAQTWSPTGATWWHRYDGGEVTTQGVVRTTCTGDTTINGEPARLAYAEVIGFDSGIGQAIYHDLGPVITKSEQGRVSTWDGFTWRLLFDLDASVGDQWLIELGSLDVISVTVTGTGTKNIDGQPLRYSAVEFSPTMAWLNSDTVLERIGYSKLYLNALYVFSPIYPYSASLLRCYSDPELDYSATGTNGCEPVLSAAALMGSTPLMLSPNPGSDIVRVNNRQDELVEVMLHDAKGALVLRTMLHGKAPLAVNHLQPGLYSATIRHANGQVSATRWVKL